MATTLTSMSTYLAGRLLDMALRGTTFTPPSNVFAALYSGNPEAGGTEAAGGGYARPALVFEAAGATTARQAATTAKASMVDMPAGSWDWVAILDGATDGNILHAGLLTDPVTTAAGDPFDFQPGGLVVRYEPGAITDYLAHAFMDHYLRSSSYSPASAVELALRSGGVELAGGGYSRQPMTWGAASAGKSAVSAGGAFTGLPATAALDGFAYLEDVASGGNALFVGALSESRAVAAGQGVTWGAGAFTAKLD